MTNQNIPFVLNFKYERRMAEVIVHTQLAVLYKH
jgi:hypothetical protein